MIGAAIRAVAREGWRRSPVPVRHLAPRGRRNRDIRETYYMLCRTACSTPSIVGRWGQCKVFLVHSGRRRKTRKNSAVPGVRRTITAVCTAFPPSCPQRADAIRRPTNGRRRRCTLTTPSCVRQPSLRPFPGRAGRAPEASIAWARAVGAQSAGRSYGTHDRERVRAIQPMAGRCRALPPT